MANSVQQLKQAQSRMQQALSPLLRLALLLGIAFHLAGFLFFRVTSNPLPERVATPPFVQYVSVDSVVTDTELAEQAALFDSAPLFIPTRWNASQVSPMHLRGAARCQFPEFEPEINLLAELQPASRILNTDLKVSAPIDLLASRYWHFFADFPLSSDPVVALSESMPVAEVSVVGDPIAETLSLTADMKFSSAVQIVRPVQYYLRVSPAGEVLSAPTLSQSSGSEEFDVGVAQWLGRPEVLAQLPSGYLSIQVFPW